MGTWGVGPFDNDDAADWLDALADTDDDSLLHEALEEVAGAGAGEYIEASWAAIVIAPAEIVAAAAGKPDPGLPSQAEDWVRQNQAVVTDELRLLALAALDNAAGSELAELWRRSPDVAAWTERTNDLRERLR